MTGTDALIDRAKEGVCVSPSLTGDDAETHANRLYNIARPWPDGADRRAMMDAVRFLRARPSSFAYVPSDCPTEQPDVSAIPSHTSAAGEQEPVAWRVKDYADEWLLTSSRNEADYVSSAMGGALVQPLVPAARIAFLQAEVERLTALTEAMGHATKEQRSFSYQSREEAMIVLERDTDGKPTIWCDPEIAPLVKALNDGGVKTVASCSGHGKRPGNIALADGRELIIAANYAEGRAIDSMLTDINGRPSGIADAAYWNLMWRWQEFTKDDPRLGVEQVSEAYLLMDLVDQTLFDALRGFVPTPARNTAVNGLLDDVRAAVVETANRPARRRGPYVFDEAKLQEQSASAKSASLQAEVERLDQARLEAIEVGRISTFRAEEAEAQAARLREIAEIARDEYEGNNGRIISDADPHWTVMLRREALRTTGESHE